MSAKLETLNFIDENGSVSVRETANYFGVKYETAKKRFQRLQKQGLIEPLLTERGRWILSALGDRRLDYLRREEDEQRRREKARSARGRAGIR